MPIWLNNMITHFLMMAIGYVIIEVSQIYRDKYRKDFFQNPEMRMGFDVLWMLLFQRAPIVTAILAPIVGWFFFIAGFSLLLEQLLIALRPTVI